MPNDPLTGYIRAKVVCVFRNQGQILVGDAFDPTKQQLFYCPPGGRIEFGESSEVALRREIEEELGSGIENPLLLGVLENLFTFDGKKGHEIVFVYDAELSDKALYAVDSFKACESNGEPFNAIWLNLSAINSKTPPLYPVGLLELLKNT
ncbi:MAG: NUDIX domain-containing protein [Candidatus Riflebacteria bacterium]|nr:NUDIX domain-containing protein [Candidatus Riflebacteria bacterium]